MMRLDVLSLELFNFFGFDALVFFAPPSREFTHRVKSVSMAKFSSQEVDALQKGGNQVRFLGGMHSLWCVYIYLLILVLMQYFILFSGLEKSF